MANFRTKSDKKYYVHNSEYYMQANDINTARMHAYRFIHQSHSILSAEIRYTASDKVVGEVIFVGSHIYYVPKKGKARIVYKDGSLGKEVPRK